MTFHDTWKPSIIDSSSGLHFNSIQTLYAAAVTYKTDNKSADTKLDKFTKLENIFVELVVVDNRKDGLVQPL